MRCVSQPPVWAQQPEGPEPRQAVGQAFSEHCKSSPGQSSALHQLPAGRLASSWLVVATPEGDILHSNDYGMAMV